MSTSTSKTPLRNRLTRRGLFLSLLALPLAWLPARSRIEGLWLDAWLSRGTHWDSLCSFTLIDGCDFSNELEVGYYHLMDGKWTLMDDDIHEAFETRWLMAACKGKPPKTLGDRWVQKLLDKAPNPSVMRTPAYREPSKVMSAGPPYCEMIDRMLQDHWVS